MFRATVKDDEPTYISASPEHPIELLNAAGDKLFRKAAPDVDNEDTELGKGEAVTITDGQFLISASRSEIVVREVKAGTFEESSVSGDSTVGDKLTVNGEAELNGDLNHDGAKAGFFGVAPAERPNVKPAAEVDAKELCEALEKLGLVQ